MPSIENWWNGNVDWTTSAGQLLEKFLVTLPKDRPFAFTLYGSAPLQLTVDRELMSADVDLFSENEEDLSALISIAKLDKERGGFYLEPGYELSFRTSPRWRQRAKLIQLGNVTLTVPHPLDILIGKLARLDVKDIRAFTRIHALTGHPTASELKEELQHAVDLFRPAFDADSPNLYPENTKTLWRELYKLEIDVRKEIIDPAIGLRNKGYGELPPDYKGALGG
ncbi:MAG: hypothetical protein JWN25_1463 [Verrucomicrobiales bacterium]|nr:hypothetical protein [Verrucomicrobiales bacterium]